LSSEYDTAAIEQDTQWQAEPVEPIVIKDLTKTESPQYGSCMTWQIPVVGSGVPVQILQRRRTRTTGAISIIALGGATSIIFNSKLDPLQGNTPQGATFQAVGTRVLEWENQQPLHAIGQGGAGPVTITVIDEAYAER